MAKIIDPDGLVRASTFQNLGVDGNIFINPDYRMFYLAPFGSLDQDDGVTTQVPTKSAPLRKTTSLRKTSSRHDTIERIVGKTFSDIQGSNVSVAETPAAL